MDRMIIGLGAGLIGLGCGMLLMGLSTDIWAVIQGVGGVLVFIATYMLVRTTQRYVTLTSELARAAQRSAEMGEKTVEVLKYHAAPDISATIETRLEYSLIESWVSSGMGELTFVVTNVGISPVVFLDMRATLESREPRGIVPGETGPQGFLDELCFLHPIELTGPVKPSPYELAPSISARITFDLRLTEPNIRGLREALYSEGIIVSDLFIDAMNKMGQRWRFQWRVALFPTGTLRMSRVSREPVPT